jgi:hypothetical protein
VGMGYEIRRSLALGKGKMLRAWKSEWDAVCLRRRESSGGVLEFGTVDLGGLSRVSQRCITCAGTHFCLVRRDVVFLPPAS